jgi:myo-inositol-1(or 4)-monophosphatase
VNNACKIGIIYAPDMRKMFIGVDGYGSFCNKRPLHIQKLEASQQVIIGVGTSARTSFEDYLQTLSLLQQQGFEHRRLGAGALMLAEVAAGSLQGYFEPHMNSWDALAGLLLVREAGGSHFNFLASEENIKTGNRVFAASRIISELLSFLLAEIK